MKTYKQYNKSLNENKLRFDDKVKLEADLNVLLEMYQEYYEHIEIAKEGLYDPEVIQNLTSLIDNIDGAVHDIKKMMIWEKTNKE